MTHFSPEVRAALLAEINPSPDQRAIFEEAIDIAAHAVDNSVGAFFTTCRAAPDLQRGLAVVIGMKLLAQTYGAGLTFTQERLVAISGSGEAS